MRLVVMTALLTSTLACAAPSANQPGEPEQATKTSDASAPIEKSFYLGGIQVNEADHEAWFEALAEEGMNTVQVTDYARQGDWDSDNLSWNEESPWVVEEIRGAKQRGLAVVLVLRVDLDSSFERNAFLWHGMIMPKTDALIDSWFEKYGRFVRKWAEIAEREGVDMLMIGSELNALASTLPIEAPPALEEYFLNDSKQDNRRQQVLAHKELIESTELSLQEKERFDTVEQYLEARIATEQSWARLLSAEGAASAEDAIQQVNARRTNLEEHWTRLISDLRSVYRGRLGYAANFDQYHEVGFWPQLDVMGINAYFKLRHQVFKDFNGEQLYPLLEQGWQAVLGEITDFRTEQGLASKPVVFTEMGFTWRRNSTLEPWSYSGFSVIDQPAGPDGETEQRLIVWTEEPKQYEERALAVRALHAAHSRLEKPFLNGILYWKLSSHDYHEAEESFVVQIGGPSADPILPELRRFMR